MPSFPHPRHLLIGLLILIFPWAVIAQIPPDEVLKDFKVNGEFQFQHGTKTLSSAEILFSNRAVAYLIMAPELTSPLLVSMQSREVQSLEAEKVIRNDDDTVHILADAMLEPVGAFTLSAQRVVFTAFGQKSLLKPRPWLLGKHSGKALKAHNPEYAYKASQYEPAAEELAAIKSQTRDVRVRVYFGSWCPHCKQIVPRVLRVADELVGSKVQFEYYGLSKPLGQEPIVREEKIRSVPTAVVYIDGEEVERLTGEGISEPEKALNNLLSNPGDAGS